MHILNDQTQPAWEWGDIKNRVKGTKSHEEFFSNWDWDIFLTSRKMLWRRTQQQQPMF